MFPIDCIISQNAFIFHCYLLEQKIGKLYDCMMNLGLHFQIIFSFQFNHTAIFIAEPFVNQWKCCVSQSITNVIFEFQILNSLIQSVIQLFILTFQLKRFKCFSKLFSPLNWIMMTLYVL